MTSKLQERGYKIVNGYGSLRDKTFRIGHMGEATVKDLNKMLKVLSEILETLK